MIWNVKYKNKLEDNQKNAEIVGKHIYRNSVIKGLVEEVFE